MYNTNLHGEIINGSNTYESAAYDLVERGGVVLNWTDERGTLLNISLSYGLTRVGALGGIVDGGTKVWVGVAGHGMFGFRPTAFVEASYANEKLGVNGLTATKVGELITGVLKDLQNLENTPKL